MALDQLPIELLTCTSVPAAVALLEQRDIQLVITDLMLPGESGISLVQRLSANPAAAGWHAGGRLQRWPDDCCEGTVAGNGPLESSVQTHRCAGTGKLRARCAGPACLARGGYQYCNGSAAALPHQPGCQTSPSHEHCRDIGHCQPILVATHNSSPPTVRHVSSSLPPMCKRVMPQRKRKTGLLCAGWPTASPPCSSHWAGRRQPGRQGAGGCRSRG